MEQVRPFLEELASSAPVPGGGSVAALSASMGAALLVMVCNLTLGRKRFQSVEAQTEQLRLEAQDLLDRCTALAQDDANAYGRVSAAMALPRSTDSEQAYRQARVQEALKGAALPPLETMRAASDVVRLAAKLASIGNPSAITDVGTASLISTAAYSSARLNVLINLGAVSDSSWTAGLSGEMTAVADPSVWNLEVQNRVNEVLEVR